MGSILDADHPKNGVRIPRLFTTFGRFVVMAPQVGTGNITLRGNSVTPANVTLTATGIGEPAGVVEIRNFAVLFVQDFTLTCVTSGSGLQARDGGVIYVSNMRFGACAHYHMHAASNAFIKILAAYAIVGAAAVHIRPGSLSEIRSQDGGVLVTITGTPAIAIFVQAYLDGLATLPGMTFSGGTAGQRFEISGNSICSVSGGLNDLPGNVAGIVASGGQYVGLTGYATDAQVRAATPKFALTADNIETASNFVGMVAGTFDWDAGINRFVTLNSDQAIGNPTNNQVGTWRTLWVVGNDATPRTLTFSGNLVGNVAPITGITNTQRVLLHIFALDPTFAWVSPPSGKF